MSNLLDQDWGGDESDGEDFNPGQHVGSDDEGEKNPQGSEDVDGDNAPAVNRQNQNGRVYSRLDVAMTRRRSPELQTSGCRNLRRSRS